MVPKHVVIIPDGNRRWAKKNNKSLLEGYEAGISKIGDVLKWCKEEGIQILTLWGFSTENTSRDKNEIGMLMDLFDIKLRDALANQEFEKEKIRVKVYGRREFFPQNVRESLGKLEKATEKFDKYRINILLGYGGRKEIVDACNAAISDLNSKKISEIDEATFAKYLYTSDIPDPDIVIRTSGERRLSGIMPWQTTYSELFFCEKLWPEFTREDLKEILHEYEERERRFGR
ncbi:MAG: polyprenyl diphosphate synthase [Candidatus Micrarchaeota archaeon]